MTSEIKRILFATDLEENEAAYLFRYAVDMAKRYEAEIVIIHVVERGHSLSYAGAGVEALMRGARKSMQESGAREIEDAIRTFCTATEAAMGAHCLNLVQKVLVPIGNPVEEILKAAEAEQCEALLMGFHKKGTITKRILGSVARSILEESNRPVFVVPVPPGIKKADTAPA